MKSSIISLAIAVSAPVAVALAQDDSLGSHCELANPSSTECDAFSTTHFITNDEPAGLSFIGLNVDVLNMRVADNAPFIRMLFNGVLLKSINPADETRVNFISAGMLVEDGTGDFDDFKPVNTLFMVFSYYGDRDFYDFVKTGTYTLEIPDGAFEIDGKLLKGYTIEYHYTAEMSKPDMTYQLTPSPENTVTDLAAFAGDGLTLTFPNARIVQAKRRSGAQLSTPSGRIIDLNRESNTRKGFRYRVPADVTLDECGEYVFTVAAGNISIDQPSYYEGSDAIPNFPGLEARYYVDDSSVGIAEIKDVSETSGGIYSIDGRLISGKASLQDLKSLSPGIYVINGRKIRVR